MKSRYLNLIIFQVNTRLLFFMNVAQISAKKIFKKASTWKCDLKEFDIFFQYRVSYLVQTMDDYKLDGIDFTAIQWDNMDQSGCRVFSGAKHPLQITLSVCLSDMTVRMLSIFLSLEHWPLFFCLIQSKWSTNDYTQFYIYSSVKVLLI